MVAIKKACSFASIDIEIDNLRYEDIGETLG